MNRVLIVSPNKTLSGDIEMAALSQGWQAMTVWRAPTTMRVLYAGSPEAVILDVDPCEEPDAWIILRRIREVVDVPVLAIMKDAHRNERISALEAGASAVASRTCDPSELMMRARNLALNVNRICTPPGPHSGNPQC